MLMDFFQPVLDALYAAVSWLFDLIATIALGILQPLLDFFPSLAPAIQSAVSTWMSLLYYVEVANAWIPVDAGMVFLGIYSGFLLVFLTVKFVLKLIPFIG
jgi:hypothetical protein